MATRRLTLVEPPPDEAWDKRVSRQIHHQARIEAAFDRADACERFGNFEQALAWLRKAEDLSGGSSPASRALRARSAAARAR